MSDLPSTEDMIAEVTPAADATQETAQPQDGGQTEGAASVAQEYEYTANGKTIKEPLDAILKRASQGYNYSQHMAELKARETDLQTQAQRAQELEKKYGEIDKFAQENPEWNEHLHSTWNKRFDVSGGQQQGETTAQQQGLPPQLQQEFNELKTFVESMKAEKADQAYSQAVDKVKQSYPDVDFSHTDPDTGRTLEQRVLDYAQENSIGRFEPAFKAFYADKMVEQARLQAKEQLAGDMKQRAKAGILGVSQAPTKGNNAEMEYPANYKQMSSDQLHNWIVGKFAN